MPTHVDIQYMYYSGKISNYLLAKCEKKNKVLHDTFVDERTTEWILQTHPVVAVVIFIRELTEESLQHPWCPARGQLCQRLAKTESSHRG